MTLPRDAGFDPHDLERGEPRSFHTGRGERVPRGLDGVARPDDVDTREVGPVGAHDSSPLPGDVRVLRLGNVHAERLADARDCMRSLDRDAPELRRTSTTSAFTLILNRFNPSASRAPTPTSRIEPELLGTDLQQPKVGSELAGRLEQQRVRTFAVGERP